MSLNLDQTSDYSNQELYMLLNDIDCPAFVKNANIEDMYAPVGSSTDAFADQFNKAYPITSPAAVYVSNAHFVSKKADLQKRWGEKYVNDVEARLKTAAEIFNISADVTGYTKTAMEKAASDYSTDYIYESTLMGKPISFFPVKTKEDFEKAASICAANLSNYTFEMRKGMAESFVKKAASYDVDALPAILMKYAGMYFYDPVTALEHVNYRQTLLNPSLQEKTAADYDKIKTMVKQADSKETMLEAAEALHNLDVGIGIFVKEKSALATLDPVEGMFTISAKQAAELLNVVNMGGENFKMADLKAVPQSVYKEAFGVDFDTNNETELRDNLPTMPLSDVGLFKELSGIKQI